MRTTIVIPAFNEEKRIIPLLKDIRKKGYNFLVVDDGSVDNTYYNTRKHTHNIIQHKINLGKGAAMKTGADAAFKLGADAVIFMDSDGQHKVNDLEKFITKLNSGDKLILGSRNWQHGVPLVRYLGNKMLSISIVVLYDKFVTDILCGFRAMTKEVYEKIRWESSGYSVESEIIVNAAKRKISHTEINVATVYHDKFKGVTILEGITIMLYLLKWRIR